MSKHLHSRTEYCYTCGSVAIAHCKKCSMPICLECSLKFHGKCDLCADNTKEENLMLGMNNGYEISAENQYNL